MKNDILINLNDARQLEKLYRNNKGLFRKEFSALYPTVKGNSLADFWNERLNYEGDQINLRAGKELSFVIIVSLLAGIIAKLPAFLNIDEEFFYTRNIGFIVFPALAAWFAWKNKLSASKIGFIVSATIAAVVFINSLPDRTTDSITLSSIHLLLVLWSILGFAFAGENRNNAEKRLGYLSYNGDLIVMTTLIAIAGGILSAITIGLFSLIGFNIEEFYFKNIVVFLLPAAPIMGTYLIQTNPQLVGKVSPVIARIFSPLVLLMLVIYLVAIIYSGKNPYNDREFLMIFNALLIGVMAIIFFSIAESSKTNRSRAETWILFLLSIITIIVNGIALSAIVFRISEWGVTPNRIAVLGGNILILVNLLLVTAELYKIVTKKADYNGVGRIISYYLPVYSAWAIIVTFVFPFVFGFR